MDSDPRRPGLGSCSLVDRWRSPRKGPTSHARARDNGYVVVTHDLDFGTLLAASSAQKPSVIQVRTHDVMPETLTPVLIDAIQRFGSELEEGALVVIEPSQARVRILPLT